MALGEIFGGVLGLFTGDVLGNILSDDARTAAATAAKDAIGRMGDAIAGTAAAKNSVSRALGAAGQRASLGYGLFRDQLRSMWQGSETYGRGLALRRLLENDTLDDAVRQKLIAATKWNPQAPASIKDLGAAYDAVMSELTRDTATDKMRAVAASLASASKNYTTGLRVGMIGTGALIGGGALYALGSVRRGDYGGAAIGAGVAGLGAWAALRAGVGSGLTGVMAAYEKELIRRRALSLGLINQP